MPEFDLYEWKVGKDRITRPLGARNSVTLKVSCTEKVQVRLVSGAKEIPIKTGEEFTVRFKTREAEELVIEGSPGIEFGYSLIVRELQDGDPINDENPPAPPLPGHTNLLLQMRQLVREEMRRSTQPVLEPENLAFHDRYEIDEDDYLFEEEIGLQRAQERSTAPKEPPDPKTQGSKGKAAGAPSEGLSTPPEAPAEGERPLAAE